ncbi:hypothetical protein A1359_11795 [Methylomonas lenta]|uniref:Lipoprotein n=1 Tax=Methylomonas lenta TaxID=980561 RepID=A0A177N953_9GAMM|nr:hypothetical protein [Methylomonas lenta]OAI13620.1 hypothetical protein A1359_11795 [Methylomonas lenta]
MNGTTGFKIVLLMLALSGCASVNVHEQVGTSKTLVASGDSQFNNSGQLSVNNRWLSAQQLAKLNAYRGLADQLYYEPLGGNKTVGSQVISHEVYRVYLDIYLRGARATDYRTAQNNLKTTLELTLTPRFYQCMSGDVTLASQCIQEEDKLAFTRLGYKTAAKTTANLACDRVDCSDQFYVSGFSKESNPVDGFLLEAGLYDVQWTVNTGARTLFNYLLINGFINAL